MSNRKSLNIFVGCLFACILSIVINCYAYADEEVVAFNFNATNCQTGQKLENYGDKNGYSSTSGSGELFCYMGTEAVRALEWSDPEYVDGNFNIAPIVRASAKNQWGDTPAFIIQCSTKGMYNIKFSAQLGGSSNAPAKFKAQYSIDGNKYIDIDGTDISISFEQRKTLASYYSSVNIPEQAWDKGNVYIRIIVSSTKTIAGGNYKNTPSGGELAINHIVVSGDKNKPTQEAITQPIQTETQPQQEITTNTINEGAETTSHQGVEKETTTSKENSTNKTEETKGKGESPSEGTNESQQQAGENNTQSNNTTNSNAVEDKNVNNDEKTETVNEDETTTDFEETTTKSKSEKNKKDKKDKKKNKKEKEDETKMTSSQLKSQKVNNVIIVVVLAVALAAGIVAAILISKRRKE